MDEKNLISVIIPAYNVATWLPACLNSILNQTYKNLEIIVIDDGATDDTAKIIDEFAKKDSRIVAVHQKNEGLVAVRNKGIKLATGEYITFVDGDDKIMPDMYERLMRNAIKYQADISHCGVAFCFPNGKEELHYGTGKIVVQNHFEGLKDLLEGRYIEPAVWNKLYRASILQESCLDESVLNNEDLLRNFVAFDRAKISVYEDFCGYLYLQRSGSMSKDEKRMIDANRHIYRARKVIVEHANDEIYPYAMQTWLSSIVNAVTALTYTKTPEAKKYCKECRMLLKQEQQNLHYLIKRQQIAAKLIIISPMFHRIIYRIYKKK